MLVIISAVKNHQIKILGAIFALALFFGVVSKTFAANTTVTYTSQADWTGAILMTGMSTTTSSGDLQLPALSFSASPATSTKNVAVVAGTDAELDATLNFLLSAYFPNFSYATSSADDDVYDYSDITDVSVLSGYDIVVTQATSTTKAAQVPQTILDQFADAGGTVVQGLLEYSSQRQTDTYTENINFTNNAASTGDITYDGTDIWQLDDTSPEKIYKISTTTGEILATYCAPDTVPRGIVYASGTLYISDSASDKLYAIAPNALTAYDGVCASPAQGTVFNLSDLSPDSTSPWGLAHDGTYFWLVDSSNRDLYKFSVGDTTLTQISSTSLTSILTLTTTTTLPRGLAFDGTYLWYADPNNNLIYEISPTSSQMLGAFDPYDGWDGYADTDPTGITFINGDLWVADADATAKKLYNLSSYHRDKDSYAYFNKGNTAFETPYDEPKGMAFDGTNLWLVDDYSNTLYKMSTSGVVLYTTSTPATRPNGLAYYDGTLYLSDSHEDKIYLINAVTGAVTGSYSSPSTLPKGLAHDGTYLWHADSDTDLIYKLNPADGSVSATFTSPGTTPRGLAYYEGNLWVADENDDTYYEISTTTGATIHTRNVIELSAEGIAFVENQLWSVDDVQDYVYNVDSARLAVGQFATPASDAGGFTYDGSNIWAVDKTSNQIYQLNASTGAIISSFAAPANSPQDITWDGTNFWLTTDADDKIYQIDTGGSVLFSTSTIGSNPRGIVYASSTIFYADAVTNKIYNITTTSLIATYEAPGSNAGPLAYDGTHVWFYDGDERQMFKLDFFDDSAEDIIEETTDVKTSAITGIEFISGVMWSADNYFDKFFNANTLAEEPKGIIEVASDYTSPYAVDDTFYSASRGVSDGIYLQRRLTGVPEDANRTVLMTSNRGGALYIHETRSNGGHIFALDTNLLGDNYEVSRQTVPADTLFFDALGIKINPNGVHENTRPDYNSLYSDLETLVTGNPTLYTKIAEGTASNSDTIYSYNFGTAGKPMLIFTSGMHGNEEHAYIPTVRFMENLATQYNADDATTVNIFNNYYLKFIPLLNPFGIKNRVRYNARAVDINRNFDFNWSDYHSSYKGSAAFSEEESALMRDIITANSSTLVFINDAHAAMAISPGLTWGYSLITSTPSIITDIYDIFIGTAPRRWYEERAGAGRWLTYDRYESHEDKPYFGNWIGDQGLYSGTEEVMGKKDIGTERMIHTSSWYLTHYNSIMEALTARRGRAVYRIDTGNTGSTFAAAAISTSTLPTSSTVAFRYTSSDTTSASTTWYTDYSTVPTGRYLFVETTLTRNSYTEETPTLSDLSITYSAANIVPATPVNSSPADETTGVDANNATLSASAFSDSDGGTHQASQWRISTTTGDYSAPVYDSGADAANLTSITIPSSTLSGETVYYWQVRYQDSDSGWSNYSAESSFTTAATTVKGVTVTQSGGATAVAENGATDTYTIVLNAAPTASVAVSIATGGQTSVSPTTLTFTTGNWDTPQTVTVSAVDDQAAEGAHSDTLIHTAVSADSGYNGIAIGNVSVTITDNDAGTIFPGAPAYPYPVVPTGGFKITINDGATTTASATVTLKFNALNDVARVSLADNYAFRDGSTFNYAPTASWRLSDGDGIKYVYAKFTNQYGNVSHVVSAAINLNAQPQIPSVSNDTIATSTVATNTIAITTTIKPVTKSQPPLLVKTLRYGNTNNDVKKLQAFLRDFEGVKIPVTGFFGQQTYAAVIKFQEKYAREILLPWALKRGTGLVGPTTIKKINALYAAKQK